MKKTLQTIFLSLCGIGCLAQTTVKTAPTTKPAIDTAHYWTIHGQNILLINQASFLNWSAGGINSVAGNVVLNYDFDYKKHNWSWDNKVILAYGLNQQNGLGWRKSDDRIILNSLVGYRAAKNWLYTFYGNFQTQFTNGYSYNNNQASLLSSFFAPAYLTFGPGFAYKKSDNLRLNISPLASRFTFVDNDSLSRAGAFGVTAGRRLNYELGASFDAYYKFKVMDNVTLENLLKVYSDYLNIPTNLYTDFTSNLFMKVNKFVTVNAGIELVSDPNVQVPFDTNGIISYHSALQVKQIFGAGITYKF